MQGVVFVGSAEVEVEVAVAFIDTVPLTAEVVEWLEPFSNNCEVEEDVDNVGDAVEFLFPIMLALFIIDPDMPEFAEVGTVVAVDVFRRNQQHPQPYLCLAYCCDSRRDVEMRRKRDNKAAALEDVGAADEKRSGMRRRKKAFLRWRMKKSASEVV